jgi:hypothetical protein
MPSSSPVAGEIIYHLNDFDSQNKSIIFKKNHYFPSFVTTKNLKQNVGRDKEIKSGLNIFNSIIPKQEEETTSFIKEQNANINSPLNLESSQENHYYNIKLKINLLESKEEHSNIMGDSSKNPEFENHSYSKNTNNKFNDQFLDEIPIISKIFTEQIKMPKNFINFNLFFDNNVNRPKVCKNLLFKNNHINQKVVSFVNEKPVNDFNHYSKINFNVPDNFLINYNIKEICIDNVLLRQDDVGVHPAGCSDEQITVCSRIFPGKDGRGKMRLVQLPLQVVHHCHLNESGNGAVLLFRKIQDVFRIYFQVNGIPFPAESRLVKHGFSVLPVMIHTVGDGADLRLADLQAQVFNRILGGENVGIEAHAAD